MKNKLLAVTAIGIIAVFLVLFLKPVEVVEEIPIYLVVGEHIGFNIENTSLNFGTIPPGGQAVKEINIQNSGQHELEILITGNVKKFISIEPKEFNVQSDQITNVEVTAYVPSNTPKGNYTGTLLVVIR